MDALDVSVLEQLIAGAAEPLVVARIDLPDWPVTLCNPAFDEFAGRDDTRGEPFADVIEALIGRELALEVSEAVRQAQETALPVEAGGREWLLGLRPLQAAGGPDADAGVDNGPRYVAAYWRTPAGNHLPQRDREAQHALLKAKRRIRDLSRNDSVTGLLNRRAFEDVLAHDWAVARREQTSLALVAFQLQDFDDYIAVFGRHAADSCLRRVAQAIRRRLRRASDVAARVDATDGDRLVVLAHASDADKVRQFAEAIAAGVRELGLHHPRASREKYVTVSHVLALSDDEAGRTSAQAFLEHVLKS